NIVEGDWVDELSHGPRAPLSPEVIEADGGCYAEEPTIPGAAVVEVVSALDGSRDRFLTQVVGICTAPGHPIAVCPQPLPAALDRREYGGHPALRHGSRSTRTSQRAGRVRLRGYICCMAASTVISPPGGGRAEGSVVALVDPPDPTQARVLPGE